MLATLALPVLVMWQPTRRSSAIVALLYFASAGRAILHTSAYLQTTGTAIPPAILLAAAAALQAIVWVVAWGRELRALRATVAVLVTTLPPFGFVSWAHPFHAAGLLFPSTGVLGLALLMALIGLVIWEPLATFLVLALALSSRSSGPPPTPSSWIGMRTHFGDVFRGDNPLEVVDAVAREIRENRASVHVWPESIVPHWNDATELFWADILADAKARGKILAVGSTISLPHTDLVRLRNVAVIKGTEEPPPVDQRTPVPVGTWHPIRGDGVPLSLFSSVVREIAGERAAFIICYEQLLSWSYLPLLVERPTVLVGMANVYWVKETTIPIAQTACLKSWARLFNIPFVEAVNQ